MIYRLTEAAKGWRMSARIIVIDDEESIGFTFERFLTTEGHIVATAESCSEALALINETSFDVISADIILGDGTGIDILREIRARGLICPVIMITGDPALDPPRSGPKSSRSVKTRNIQTGEGC